MDSAKQHWPILRRLGTDLGNRVREFMVIGPNGDGAIVATKDGQGFWLGEMKFGLNETKTTNKPISLEISDLVQMAQGDDYILLLNKLGEIYSMGKNNCGQLGLGTKDKKTCFSPQLIPSQHKFISVRCGKWHSVALTEDGKVWTWGTTVSAQARAGLVSLSVLSPSKIPELDPYRVVAVECGRIHSLALTDRGEVYAWGDNGHGQVGYKTFSQTITRILTTSPVKSMAAGSSHTLLLTQTGEVWACGSNNCGQLGIPRSNVSIAVLSKVEDLPSISQIASHRATNFSIAMTYDQRCFVWGQFRNETSMPPFYSTVESPLSFYSTHRSTPHSVTIPEILLGPLSARMSRMFDNPETSPDVQFVVEQRTIHAHRIILSNSSDYFARMFSERWMAPVDPEDPIVRVTITDNSYPVFHAFLRFLYTDSLEVHLNFIPDLFELANLYLVLDLKELCLSRMRATLTPSTCCLYYPLTHRHSLLPELNDFQQELVQFASTQLWTITRTSAYRSMERNLCNNLYKAARNFPDTSNVNSSTPKFPKYFLRQSKSSCQSK